MVDGRTALITGGAGGLGAAVTRRFLDAGWRVVMPWIGPAEDEPPADDPALVPVRADLFDAADVLRTAERATADAARPLAAVVNLVGGFASGSKVADTPIEDFEAQLRLNLRATYLVSQACLPHLVARGGGAITAVSSRAALRPFPGAAGYVTSKLAVLGLVDAMAAEYLHEGVRVNAVLPSVIDTSANRTGQPAADHSQWVRPEQIAEVVYFLSGEGASAISGAHIPVYGRA
jgi:NAD(P)-dependent dehydrogenase (short-subunit alcohol dehydrogenase family)